MPAGEGDTGRPTAEEERRACDESGEGGDVVDWVVKHSAKLKARLADEKRRRLDAESRLLEAQEARRAVGGVGRRGGMGRRGGIGRRAATLVGHLVGGYAPSWTLAGGYTWVDPSWTLVGPSRRVACV